MLQSAVHIAAASFYVYSDLKNTSRAAPRGYSQRGTQQRASGDAWNFTAVLSLFQAGDGGGEAF